MDGSGHHENDRQKTEHYKPVQGQWLMHQPSMKHIMTVMAERDAALQERNLAVSEKKAAQTERDMALMQRDAAIQERNTAIMERDTAIATLQYRDNTINRDDIPSCQPGCQISRGLKHLHHLHPTSCDASDATYYLQPPPHADASKPRKPKRVKEAKPMALNKKAVKSPRKIKKEGGDDVNKIVWKGVPDIGGEAGGDLNKQLVIVKPEWKGQELGLNQVAFDDSTMPAPGCSCTGVLRQCYKWGNGGWQSSCCTTTISMHPLPAMPNKRHARVGGRKMSGGAFSKLLSRLSAEGHDLSAPVDLKEHWAKHGTNRYITIK